MDQATGMAKILGQAGAAIKGIFSKKKEPVKPQTVLAASNKKIFLLTDGEVSSPEEVINLARTSECRVHSFGVGRDCSKYLVKEVAKAGRGSSSFILDA